MGDTAGSPELPHGIMELQPQPWPFMTLLIVGLLLACVIGLALWFWRRKGRTAASPGQDKERAVLQDPWQAVEERLQALTVAEPWGREASEEFYYQLSFALRLGIELQTSLPVTGQTLAETRRCLTKFQPFSADFKTDMLSFLSLAEELKFSGRYFDSEQSRQHLATVKVWLQRLRSGTIV